MAKFKFIGIEEYTERLQKLGDKKDSAIKYAVYPGAKVVADAIRAEIETNHKREGDLAKSLSLVTMRNDKGYINTKIMFADYDSKGVPNAIKAAALESGTSKGQKGTHFISRIVKSYQSLAIQKMKEAFDEIIGQIMEG